MLNIQKRCPPREKFDAELVLPFDLRQKTRLRTQTTAGEETGLFLPRGSILRDGDFLEAEDGRIVKVTAKPEKVLQIGAGWLRIANDYVLRQMVEGLGASWY